MEKDENMDLGHKQVTTPFFNFVWCKERCYFEAANTKKGLR